MLFFFLMIQRRPRSTRPVTRFPYTTRFRSEQVAVDAAFLRRYCRRIVRAFLMRREPAFLDYHLAALRKIGRLPGVVDVVIALAAEAGASVANPGKAVRQLLEGFNRDRTSVV